jgi:uncharacterized protein involved in outer membrane biogenesis
MEWLSAVRSRPAFRKGLIAGLIIVVSYSLFGYFGLPAILESVLPRTLSDTLHRKTTIREIRFDPFKLSLSIRGLEIGEREGKGTWISVKEMFANIQFASIFRGGPVLGEIRFIKPYVNIVRHADRTYNFTDLIEIIMKRREDKSKRLKYSLNNIEVIDGGVYIDDGPKKVHHEVRNIHLAIPFLSNLPYYVDRYVHPSFSAVVNGDNVSLKGRSKPFSDTRETVFDVNVAGLNIPHYLEYVPFRLDYEIPSAFLDVKSAVSFGQPKGKPPTLRVEGEVTLREVRVRGKDKKPMLHLPMIKGTISPSDIVAREFGLANLTVKDPEIHAAIDRNGKLNFLVLSGRDKKENVNEDNVAKPAGPAEPTSPEATISIAAFRLSGGKLRFSDASRANPFLTEWNEIRLDADGLSTEKGKTGEALVSFHTEAGETFNMKGNLTIAPLSSEGTVALGKVVLKKYAPYFGGAVRFDVASGTLDVRSGYRFAREIDESKFLFSGLSATLSDVRLKHREGGEEFLRIPVLSVNDAQIDPGRRGIVIGEASTSRGTVAVRRDPRGQINVALLLAEEQHVDAPATSVRSAEDAAGKPPEGEPWVVTIRTSKIERYTVRFEDRSTDPPVELSLDRIQLRAENVTTEKNRNGKFSFSNTIRGGGSVSLDGVFSIDPPSLRARVRGKALPIAPMQPYFTDKVKILVAGGAVSGEGNLSIDATKGSKASVAYIGEASVNGFSSLDKARGEEFLNFGTLHLGGVEAGYNPTKVIIDEIALSDFYSRIIVNPDATLNVQGIVAKEAAGQDNVSAKTGGAGPDVAAKPSAAPVRIGTVTLQGGTILFSDQYVNPTDTASLVEIGGRISGLSSEESRRADVDLRGKLEHSAPLEIRGKINPLAENLFVDLKVDFKEMDLSPLSPYAGRYAGYGIRKGKLALNLKYHIEKNKLDAENKVFLDQFTFGEAIDSPKATKLPVRLAVALLKDRKGEIRLDLPVTGRIDDPKFSVWGIVVKILVNLLTKAATSPFALLGALFGGGEELAYLEFEPGLSVLPAAAEGKIGNLAKILYERPALKLEIEGHVDLEKDKEALRQLSFRRKIAAQKVRELARGGAAAPAIDNVRVEPAEYPKFLTRAYKEEKFPKPRNFLGMARDLPVPEMEKLMLTHLQVTDDDLRLLAGERASGVKDRLLRSGKVEPERIFLVEPKTLSPERKEKMKDSRVDFRIR